MNKFLNAIINRLLVNQIFWTKRAGHGDAVKCTCLAVGLDCSRRTGDASVGETSDNFRNGERVRRLRRRRCAILNNFIFV